MDNETNTSDTSSDYTLADAGVIITAVAAVIGLCVVTKVAVDWSVVGVKAINTKIRNRKKN